MSSISSASSGITREVCTKGVYFINVAQENDMKFRDNWLKVIEEDKMTWTQILNNEGQERCDVVRLFSVTTFPTKVLIDQEGRIVGRYLGDSRSWIRNWK
ncbi:MAG: TlpA family protein disulfide reductase [Butyricimonas paravirosa]